MTIETYDIVCLHLKLDGPVNAQRSHELSHPGAQIFPQEQTSKK